MEVFGASGDFHRGAVVTFVMRSKPLGMFVPLDNKRNQPTRPPIDGRGCVVASNNAQ